MIVARFCESPKLTRILPSLKLWRDNKVPAVIYRAKIRRCFARNVYTLSLYIYIGRDSGV